MESLLFNQSCTIKHCLLRLYESMYYTECHSNAYPDYTAVVAVSYSEDFIYKSMYIHQHIYIYIYVAKYISALYPSIYSAIT